MDDKRNLIAAILLSVAILLGWNFVSQKFFPTPPKPDVTRTVAGPDGAAPAIPGATPGQPGALPAPGVTPGQPGAAAAQAIRPIEAVLGEGNRIPIETPAIRGSINLVGARVDDIALSKYRQTIKKDSPPVRLFSPAGTKAAYFASFGWSAQGVVVPGSPTRVWTASGTNADPGDAGHAELGQWRRPDVPHRLRSTTIICSPPSRRSSIAAPRRSPCGRHLYRPHRQAGRPARTGQLDDPRRPDRLSRRQGQLRRQL